MIGFDLQEVERLRGVEDALLKKIALESEINYIRKFKSDFTMKVASLWSAKEAVFKALDLSEGEISYKEIELCHKESGRPFVKLYGKAKERFENLQATSIDISISHQKSVVGCVVEITAGTTRIS